MVTIIVAYDQNRVMGNKGVLPWRIPEEINHFKNMTIGNPCIMGRKTWQSLPKSFKPLPDRPNIIISKNDIVLQNSWRAFGNKNVHFESSVQDAIELSIVGYPYKEIFVIGGAQIYEYVLNQRLAHRILASEIKGNYEGDTFFPSIDVKGKIVKEFESFNVVEYKL